MDIFTCYLYASSFQLKFVYFLKFLKFYWNVLLFICTIFCYCCSFHYWKVQFYDVWIKIYTSILFILIWPDCILLKVWKWHSIIRKPHQINLKTLVHGILSNISDSQEKEKFWKDHPMTIYFPMYNLIKIGCLLDLSLFSYCHHSVPVVCPYTWNLV